LQVHFYSVLKALLQTTEISRPKRLHATEWQKALLSAIPEVSCQGSCHDVTVCHQPALQNLTMQLLRRLKQKQWPTFNVFFLKKWPRVVKSHKIRMQQQLGHC
jgi:hypothetical protein